MNSKQFDKLVLNTKKPQTLINSDRDELISKRKRRLLAAKNPKHKVAIDIKKQSPKKLNLSSIPPLPKHYFNLSGKIININ